MKARKIINPPFEPIVENVLVSFPKVRSAWSRLYLWAFWLAFMVLASGCASANAKFKEIVRSTIVDITEIVVIVSLAVAILLPMLSYFIRIIVIGLFEENWQFSNLSVSITYSIIGSIIGIFITLNSGAIVDAIVEFIKGIW
ncbi:MAG: hypothetical protein QXS54_00855 [Candidatus Methanomethylicaceae archaeon]